ncbi:3-oxoacyl-ACP reductase FabG [Sporichthya sp.]|uniref:3-oxoacyl-ACP reductase FabG n=1 Tax=Sporichthya sp. TaxID=65475 RepID=UPI0017CAA27F|nr:3-oxoacyl-ACP reductase FabG [Sporichthya sp.]MBA3741491.1 3-oxoacyl-ACP reductase FabG [Sporichthya sp.]
MTESNGRVAVVTGAARGIGAAIADRLAHEGHRVALLDLDEAAAAATAKELRGRGLSADSWGVDITDPEQVQAAVASLSERLGPPTILVNNAGITRDSSFHNMSLQDWDAVLNVHLRGAFVVTQAVQASMTAAGWGRIVNISSVSALGNRGQANYSTAKAGLQGLTRTLALELGPFGVTVNAIAPGFIATEMTDATAVRLGVTPEEFQAKVAAQTPVRRVGRPDDIAALTAFLVGEEAGFVSGQVIYAAGGPKS